jgi:hypothetical protein
MGNTSHSINPKIPILIGTLLILFISLFGCTIQGEQQTLNQLQALQEKYFVKNNFSTTQATMNDYISGLAALRSKASGSTAKIIEAEEYSAQSFYYLNKALTTSARIDYLAVKCNSTEVQQTVGSAKLAIASSTKAINVIQALSQTDQQKLRANQLEAVKGYLDNATQIKQFFDDKC